LKHIRYAKIKSSYLSYRKPLWSPGEDAGSDSLFWKRQIQEKAEKSTPVPTEAKWKDDSIALPIW
jgi:hypothetical protein